LQIVQEREQEIETLWATLTILSDDKRCTTDDHIAREQYAAQTRLLAGQHADKTQRLHQWADDKAAYLSVREICNTSELALFLLGVFDA